MISIVGFVLYGIVFFSASYFKTIREMLSQAWILAPEISMGMLLLYCYPLLVCAFFLVFRFVTRNHGNLLKRQTNLSASIAVSLGLIGTFQGLTQMVGSIAASMSGEGDMAEKMGTMIGAISQALSAMSYAFLTSILGVSVSVLLLISLNFWLFAFGKEAKKAPPPGTGSGPKQESPEMKAVIEQLKIIAELQKSNAELQKSNADTMSSLVSKEEKTQELIAALSKINENSEAIISEFVDTKQQNDTHFQHAMDIIENNHKESVNELKSLSGSVTSCLDRMETKNDETIRVVADNNEKVSQVIGFIQAEVGKVKNAVKVLLS